MNGALLSRALGGFYVDLGGGPEDAVFVAGSGRSGTTWLADILNARREYRMVFEPFYPEKVRECEGFHRRQYLRPSDRHEAYLGPARKILSGEVRNSWVDRFHRTFVARRRIVKDVRANLMLGWLAKNFPETPIVLILRHPCAVAESQTALGWKDILNETMQQRDLIQDHLGPMEREILASKDSFERRVFLWCVENYVPLRQIAPGRIHVTFHERLVEDPEPELHRLFDYLGKDFGDDILQKLKIPSPVSREQAIGGVDDWRRTVPPESRKRAGEILALFGLDRVYGEGPMPDPDGVRALMRSLPGG